MTLTTAAAAFAFSACNAKTPIEAPSRADLQLSPEVRALMDKTLKNLRFVEGGSFQMGDFGPIHSEEKLYYTSAEDNKVLHKVTLDSFSMSAYKTTYEDHDVYSRAMGKPLAGQDEITKDYRYPKAAAGLTWYQAREYCQWLGGLLKVPMDLPTEAQWEYAARNRGQFVIFASDNGKIDAGRNVWEYDQWNKYRETLNPKFKAPSLPLGQFPPTPLGLFDMMTDGYEWTLDWYDVDYYKASPEKNPTGPDRGTKKVLRSHRSTVGSDLGFGAGMTFTRSKREPDPPKINLRTKKPDPTRNPVSDTSARCVANSPGRTQAP